MERNSDNEEHLYDEMLKLSEDSAFCALDESVRAEIMRNLSKKPKKKNMIRKYDMSRIITYFAVASVVLLLAFNIIFKFVQIPFLVLFAFVITII